MPRMDPIEIEDATGKARELLEELVARGSEPGQMALTMAHAPALLRGYMDLNRAMKRTHLDPAIRERIALAVHKLTGCHYCLAAHTRAAQAVGLSEEEIELATQGTATDPKIAALVAFARQVIAGPSEISDEQFDELRELGYSLEQIAEVVGLVSLQLMTGAFNLVAGTQPRS